MPPSTIFSSRTVKENPWIVALLILAIIHLFNPYFAFAADVTIDGTVNTNSVTHNGTTFTDVFTNASSGYAFYRDADGACKYAKTNDGGATWGSAVTVDPQTDCLRIAVWYDRWTPGNTTGTLIHIATLDSGSDDMWYTRFDTATDATTTVLDISGANQGGTYTAGANLQAITRATDGTIFAGVFDAADDYVLKCSANCTTSINNWTEAGTSTTWGTAANDWLLLNPLPNKDVLAIQWIIGSDVVQSKVWHGSSSSWDTSFTTVDPGCKNNTTYDGHFGSTLNPNSNAIYLAYACNNQTLGTDDRIKTWTYTSSTWTEDTDVETTSTLGLTGAKIGLDINSGNIYVVYSGRTTPNSAATTNVYYKISTSTSMSGWGTRQGPLNNTATDIYGLRIDGQNSQRIYATWVNGTNSTLEGNTVAVLSQTTYEQSAYKFFTNTNSVAIGPEFAATNASSVIPGVGGAFRLRMLTHIGGDGADVGLANLKLQVATSTPGGCDTAFSGETYADVTTSTGNIRYFDNTNATSGVALTASSTDPTHGADTVVNQTYVESNTFSNSVAKILGGQDGKWDFSLKDASGTALDTYCFRIVKSDGSLLDTYDVVPEAQVNAPPTVSTPTLNAGSNIALTEGTVTLIQATATITDTNGNADINVNNFTGTIYRSGVGASCTQDDNNCYPLAASCSLSNCSGNTCVATCNIYMNYFADPTDTGTPWTAEDWRASITATDNRGATSTASSTAGQVDVLTLLGLKVTSNISYGSLSVGSTTDPLSQIAVVTSTGNASLDMYVYGTDMMFGANSIPLAQQHYATSSKGYATSTTLTANPGLFLDINIPKTTSGGTPATGTTYWGIAIPSTQSTGVYTGTNAFIAAENAMPWP